jgi:hypothetical protein
LAFISSCFFIVGRTNWFYIDLFYWKVNTI